MSAPTIETVGLRDLLRDCRHLAARAAPDLADWLAYLHVDGKQARTLYSYQRELALLLREYPDHALEDFTASDITNVLALKPERSRYITRSIFNAFFQWAEDDERIDRTPMRRVPKMRQPKRRAKDIYSQAEVELLSQDPLLCLMLYTGLRRGECINLRRDAINLNRARLTVLHGKGDKDRIIGLPMVALQAVNELDLTHALAGSDYVWSVIRDKKNQSSWWRSKPVGSSNFAKWYEQAVAARGVRYLNPHQTRHTYGQWLRENQVDIEERQVAMGHESIRTTQHYYGRVTTEDVAEKVAGL